MADEKTPQAADTHRENAGRKLKLAPGTVPPEDIYVDGFAGLHARAGVVKLACYRVSGVDQKDNAEIGHVTHQLVMPAASIPGLMKLLEGMVAAGRKGTDSE